jgi:ABC-2 type transport system permease protein
MLSALLYLRLTSFKNWLLTRARRLRQPKYLFGAIVGCAYFYFFFFRSLGGDPARAARRAATAQAAQAIDLAHATLPVDWLPAVTAFGALALLVFTTLMWVVPTQRAALGFSEAEIAFLFPAPITRRALVHFRLLSSQFRSLVGAAVMMLFSNRWTILGGNAFTHAVGWWFVFSALNLHFSGANFTLTRLTDAGVGAWRRRVLVLFVVTALIGLTLARLPAELRLPALPNELDLRPVTSWAIAFTTTAPLAWLLWPFKLVLGPFLAIDAWNFLLTLAPALAVIALHYLWVVRSAVAFEDSSVDYAQKRGARIAAWRSGARRMGSTPTKGRPAPFRLAGTGRPELAFLWKNLLSTWQYFNVRVLLVTAAVIVGSCLWVNTHPMSRGLLPVAGIIALFFAGYTLIVGPQFARQDIRSDLAHADVLKTYPIAGWQLVLGELLTPIVILTSILWLALLVIAFTFHPMGAGMAWLTPQLRTTAALGLAIVTPALVSLQLLVPNAAALLFPGWFQMSRTRGGGPEVIGQRMIFFFAQVITMVVALLPAGVVGALLIFILQGLIGPIAAISVAAVFVLLVLLGEVWCGIWLLGQRFEQLDLSAELRG